MSAYVDPSKYHVSRNPRAKFVGSRFGHRWSHLLADSLEELHSVAKAIGCKPEWFQDHPTLPHYDLSPLRRAKAIEHGARELPTKEILRQIALKRLAEAQRLKELEKQAANPAPEVKP